MKVSPMHSSSSENYIIELFKKVLPYKWSILFIMLILVVLMKVKLYFTPSVYESYAIIKVKVNANRVDGKDLLRDSLFKTNTVGINQEMAILQTYQTNQKALKNVNFQVQYFLDEGYKKVETYKNIPITLDSLSNIEPKIIGKDITLHPLAEGFSLESKKLKSSKVYSYDELVTTPYFTAIVSKNIEFTTPIYLKINGSSRHIYERIIKSSLAVTQLKLDTNLIKVAFKDTIPQRANNYIDALVDVYIDRSVKKKNSINEKILNFLEERLAITKKKLELSENELEKYRAENKSLEPSIQSNDSFARLSDIELKLSELQLKEQLVKNLVTFVQHNRNLDAIAPTLVEFNDQATINLINSIQTLQIREDELMLDYTDRHPKLIQLRKRIRTIKQQISLNVKNLKSTLVFKRKSLLKQKEKYEKELKVLPRKEKNLIHFKRNYEVNSKVYTYLLEKKSENELVQVASISDYEAVDRAYNSYIPIKPKRTAMLILAGIIGLLLGMALALLRSFMVNKVSKQQDIELLTRLPFYGKIPLVPNPTVYHIEVDEAYRQLAINLQFSKKEYQSKVVLFTSPNQGEGKTTTLANLTSIFAQTNYKSILVDLDFYRPTLNTALGLNSQYSGMSTYLSGRDNIGHIIFQTGYSDIDIIHAGPVPPNPSELILSSKLEELLLILKERYDYIFIDTSSLEEAPETFHLMHYSDINLIVFRENVTTKASIRRFEAQIKEKSLKNMGLVLKFNSKLKVKKIAKNKPVLIPKPIPKVLI
jgi:capsular exopolysaccharide synthesis family protein